MTSEIQRIAPQSMTKDELEEYRLHRRFDRMGRLVGDQGMKRLISSHVMVIGLGGVGSFAAESLIRSGVGELTLVDFDEICITNFNRQLHALNGRVGEKKSKVMAERMLQINPQCKVRALVQFYHESFADQIFECLPDLVIDAIDSVTAKCHLIHFCKTKGIPILSSMGTGGRLDPAQVKTADLAETTTDPLARSVRSILREKYGFPQNAPFGVTCVYSDEVPHKPYDLHYDDGKGFRCVCPQGNNGFFSCDDRNLIWGNASFVTGTVGLCLASLAVRKIVNEP